MCSKLAAASMSLLARQLVVLLYFASICSTESFQGLECTSDDVLPCSFGGAFDSEKTPFCVFSKGETGILSRSGSCERASGMLDLSNKNISALSHDVFEDMPSLTGLNLMGNALSEIDPRCFASLSALKELNLWGNQIASLPAGAFDGLPVLRKLYLDYEIMGTIPAVQAIHCPVSDLSCATSPEGVTQRANVYWR